MKTKYLILAISLIILFLSGCKKEKDLAAVFTVSDCKETVTATTAKLEATFSYPGNVKKVGVDVSENEDMSEAKHFEATVDGSKLNADVSGLKGNTLYYYRYGNNTGYGTVSNEAKTFKTKDYSLPKLTSSEVSNITINSAKCGGNITDDGEAEITERGVCWSKSQNPNINGNHKSNGTGLGSYIVDIDGLEMGIQYYARAYAKNVKGVSYGGNKSFSTLDVAYIVTSDITDIAATTAKCGGSITDDGGSAITERGVCWSKSQNPNIYGNHKANGSGIGSYTVDIDGLEIGIQYYVRAYAKNEIGISYGNEKTFVTLNGVAAITTSDVTNITATTAKCGGNITNDGGSPITERGVCWSKSQNPTIDGNHKSNGTGLGSYTVDIDGLEINTQYNVRAYAKNEIGVSYGANIYFSTLTGLPSVVTSSVTEITATSAKGGGNVTDQGMNNVTQRGVCWSTNQNPSITDNHTTDGSGTGSFTSSITGLSANTTYYVRSYATNSKGTSYGEQKGFKTNGSASDHEYVDLGLPSSLLWATCNVGASNPEDYGDYFAWGETSPKSWYDWSTYQWCNGSYSTLTKYCTQSSLGYNGFVDNKTVLEPSDDAAHVNWGGDWRMPTCDEMVELKNNCTWTWTTQGGKNGYSVTGTNGNSIFLPAAGYYDGNGPYDAGFFGDYWSSSLYTSDPSYAYYWSFDSGGVNMYHGNRAYGQSVRPVRQP